MLTSAATRPNLPAMSAAQLLSAIETLDVPGFSGTVVANASLGLPALPALVGTGSDVSLSQLLSGSHTMKLWYGGSDRQRIALIGSINETDVFHNGTDVWEWDSKSQTATHSTMPAGQASAPLPAESLTPQQLAASALAAIDPTTAVSTGQPRQVAGRDAYELVLRPKQSGSRIGAVQVAVDGQTKLPLAVQVSGRRAGAVPALDVSFTQLDIGQPDAVNFDFSPPKSATVKQLSLSGRADVVQAGQVVSALRRIGTGWTTVFGLPNGSLLGLPTSGAASSGAADGLISRVLTPVRGSWGSGLLLDSPVLSVLVTDDGRVFLGAVDPQVLYSAAAPK